MPSWRNLAYTCSLLPGVLVIAGNLTGGWFALANFLFSLVFLGLLDLVLGSDRSNEHSAPEDPFPEWILYSHALLHTGAFFSLFYGIHEGVLTGKYLVFAVLSSAVEAGSGSVVIAHELIHKLHAGKRFLGKYLLATCGNIYFYVHHLRIHHRFVGQATDAATARRGESFYGYFLRTIMQQLSQAWISERHRLRKMHRPLFSLQNELIANFLVQLGVLWLVLAFTGVVGLLAYFAYILIAALLLEYVNYIEHYGLVRGENERINHSHSWNCDKVVSRFMLIDLARHADHHFHPSKPYHTLLSDAKSPVLPGGYASLILPVLIPPWWFALVHKRLDSIKAG